MKQTILFKYGVVLVLLILGALRVSAAPPQKTISNEGEFASILQKVGKSIGSSQLKFGYFLHPGPDSLPATRGFQLLENAILKEPIATKRWFYLQDLKGFAAFCSPDINVSKGFDAYTILFDHAKDASKVGALYPLQKAINEYVALIPGKFNDLVLQGDDRTQRALSKAWNAYTDFVSANLGKNAIEVQNPQFAEAFDATRSGDQLAQDIVKYLNNPASPRTYAILKTAATILALQDRKKSIALLKEAKLLLPLRNGKGSKGMEIDPNEAARFYDLLVTLLKADGQSDAARVMQEERIKIAGTGWAELVELLLSTGDLKGVDQVLSTLATYNADERDLTDVTDLLFKMALDPNNIVPDSALKAESLLIGYLSPDRQRLLEPELNARLQLGTYYLRVHKSDKARDILTVSPTSSKLNPQAKRTLISIQGILSHM